MCSFRPSPPNSLSYVSANAFASLLAPSPHIAPPLSLSLSFSLSPAPPRTAPSRAASYSPNVKNFKGVEPTIAAPVYELPVQSAICEPKNGDAAYEGEDVEVKGYAYSGGGRGIVRYFITPSHFVAESCSQFDAPPRTSWTPSGVMSTGASRRLR